MRFALWGLVLAAVIFISGGHVLLLPLFFLYGLPKRALALFAVVLVLVLAPFALLTPGGAYNGLMAQPNRHLEYETIGASALSYAASEFLIFKTIRPSEIPAPFRARMSSLESGLPASAVGGAGATAVVGEARLANLGGCIDTEPRAS